MTVSNHQRRSGCVLVICALGLMLAATGRRDSGAAELDRTWTVYIAQDKHLDYNWCGTTTEIELRMVALLDYYVGQAEQNAGRWNLDGTLWADVYRRHRGEEGLARLHQAIREGGLGFAGNHSVLLWGILDSPALVDFEWPGGAFQRIA